MSVRMWWSISLILRPRPGWTTLVRMLLPHSPSELCFTRRVRIRRITVSVGLVAVLAAAAGCGPPTVNSPPTKPGAFGSPLRATLAWFASVNAKNLTASQAHFAAKQRDMMDWGGGRTSTWPTFSDLRCSHLRQHGSDAIVYCSFHESDAPAMGNLDSFWTVSLHRWRDGDWLIDNYGQG